jgi:hypothetical protein
VPLHLYHDVTQAVPGSFVRGPDSNMRGQMQAKTKFEIIAGGQSREPALRLVGTRELGEPSQVWRPVELRHALYRVVRRPVSRYEVEEWQGERWVPSTLPVHRIREARMATRAALYAAGVPENDWVDWSPRKWSAPELVPLSMTRSAEASA